MPQEREDDSSAISDDVKMSEISISSSHTSETTAEHSDSVMVVDNNGTTVVSQEITNENFRTSNSGAVDGQNIGDEIEVLESGVNSRKLSHSKHSQNSTVLSPLEQMDTCNLSVDRTKREDIHQNVNISVPPKRRRSSSGKELESEPDFKKTNTLTGLKHISLDGNSCEDPKDIQLPAPLESGIEATTQNTVEDSSVGKRGDLQACSTLLNEVTATPVFNASLIHTKSPKKSALAKVTGKCLGSPSKSRKVHQETQPPRSKSDYGLLNPVLDTVPERTFGSGSRFNKNYISRQELVKKIIRENLNPSAVSKVAIPEPEDMCNEKSQFDNYTGDVSRPDIAPLVQQPSQESSNSPVLKVPEVPPPRNKSPKKSLRANTHKHRISEGKIYKAPQNMQRQRLKSDIELLNLEEVHVSSFDNNSASALDAVTRTPSNNDAVTPVWNPETEDACYLPSQSRTCTGDGSRSGIASPEQHLPQISLNSLITGGVNRDNLVKDPAKYSDSIATASAEVSKAEDTTRSDNGVSPSEMASHRHNLIQILETCVSEYGRDMPIFPLDDERVVSEPLFRKLLIFFTEQTHIFLKKMQQTLIAIRNVEFEPNMNISNLQLSIYDLDKDTVDVKYFWTGFTILQSSRNPNAIRENIRSLVRHYLRSYQYYFDFIEAVTNYISEVENKFPNYPEN